MLGGTSSVNWMLYVRGHRADYDSWESLGCKGWGWKTVEKYFKKMENYFMESGTYTDLSVIITRPHNASKIREINDTVL